MKQSSLSSLTDSRIKPAIFICSRHKDIDKSRLQAIVAQYDAIIDKI